MKFTIESDHHDRNKFQLCGHIGNRQRVLIRPCSLEDLDRLANQLTDFIDAEWQRLKAERRGYTSDEDGK